MSMTASDLVQLSRLLDEALALPAPGRQAWLQSLAGADRPLRETLESLLAEHDLHEHHEFLHTLPKFGDPGRCDETVARAGERVGPYKLLRELGCGGMGSVWLANRVDNGLNRPVALKLPRLAWGAGLAERMARERDIGALLEHPHIARLYDAGLDDRGRPYLALEYIPGQPIDEWCKAQCVPLKGRLRLVAQVARAVSHAHARLVVHRDLKPSNILVTPDGQTHLLDFGIAKRLRDDDGVDSLLSRLMGRAMTPHYASPEQIRDEPVTIASDVYSLGVLLYQLLTGSLPHTPGRTTHAALEHDILENDAPLSSSRLAERGDRSGARALRGEVDAILCKALKRLPAQRYASAQALADDIERHLRGEPVQARADGRCYHASKLIARHWVGLAAITITTLAVVAGTAAALAQSVRADLFAASARMSTSFAVRLLTLDAASQAHRAASPVAAPAPGSLAEAGAGLIDASFQEQPEMRAGLYGAVAQVFRDTGQPAMAAHYAARQAHTLEQVAAAHNERARALLSQALSLLGMDQGAGATQALHEALALADGDPELRVQLLMAQVEADLAHGRLKEAGSGLDRLETLVGAEKAAADDYRPDVMSYRARWLRLVRGLDAALPLYHAALDLALENDGPLSQRVITLQRKLANALREGHRSSEAKAVLTAALASMRKLGGAHAVDAALAEAATARLMFAQQDIPFAEALATVLQARTALDRLPSPPAAARAQLDRDLGAVYALWGNVVQGDPLVSQATKELRAGSTGPAARLSLASLAGQVARDAGRHGEAAQWLGEALALRASVTRGGLESWLNGQADYALNLAMQGHTAEAEAALATASAEGPPAALAGAAAQETTVTNGDASTEAAANPDAPTGPATLRTPAGSPAWRTWLDLLRARLALDRGEPLLALSLLGGPGAQTFTQSQPETGAGTTHEVAGAPTGDLPTREPRGGGRRLVLGATHCALGDTAAGLTQLQAQIQTLAAARYRHDPMVAYWRATAGLCALQHGDRAEATRLASLARAAFAAQPGVSDYFKQPSHRLDEQLRTGAPSEPSRTSGGTS